MSTEISLQLLQISVSASHNFIPKGIHKWTSSFTRKPHTATQQFTSGNTCFITGLPGLPTCIVLLFLFCSCVFFECFALETGQCPRTFWIVDPSFTELGSWGKSSPEQGCRNSCKSSKGARPPGPVTLADSGRMKCPPAGHLLLLS